MFRFHLRNNNNNEIPNLDISLEQVNISSVETRYFDEYDPDICTYLLNHLTIANSLKQCASRAPKDFKIITKNDTEILFNKCLLSSVSETIFKIIQKNPNANSYKLESDDPTLFIQKLSQLLQGETVLLKKEERKPIRKIVGELMIDKIPNWLKPKEISLLIQSKISSKTPLQSKIAISKKSFVTFLSSKINKFNPKFCNDLNDEDNYNFNKIYNGDNTFSPFELEFDEYEKENDYYNIRAPKLDFEIKTQKNSYKCSLIAALCSDVIYSKFQNDSSIRSFFYDFDDENGSFKVVSDFLNGSLYELGPENIELSIKFATDLGIKPLLTELEKCISAYKLRISNLKSNSYIMNDILFLQNTLLSITEENIESSYNSIINSVWCDSDEMVKELSTNFILVSKILFKNLRALSKLFKKLVSSDSISKKPSLSHLVGYFKKKFVFLDVFLDNYGQYEHFLSGNCNFDMMQFVLLLKQEGVLTSKDIICNWPTVRDRMYIAEQTNYHRTAINLYQNRRPIMFLLPSYFSAEVSEVNKEYKFRSMPMPQRIRTIYEDRGTLAHSIFSDDLELFVKLLSKSGNEPNFERCIFLPYLFQMSEIPMVDFAALCGSVRIFRYLAVDQKVTVDFGTLIMAIRGRNGQILEYFTSTFVDGKKTLLEKLNENYKKWAYDTQFTSQSSDRANNKFYFANLNLSRSNFLILFTSLKTPQTMLLYSVQMHSHDYFRAFCKNASKSEMRNALLRSIECCNFTAFSYIIEKVGTFNYFKGIDVIAEKCALANSTDFLRVIFCLFDKEKLIGSSMENPPILFLNGSVKSSNFYKPSTLVAASQAGNIRMTEFIIQTANSLEKKKVLPVITAAFNSAINRNFDLFQFYVDKVGIILDDSSLVTLFSHLFSRDDYAITNLVFNYFNKNGFSRSKEVLNYLTIGAARLNDEKLTTDLIQKVIELDNTASFEQAFAAAAINDNLKLCNFIRTKPITIENIDFIQTVIDIITNNSMSTLKLFLSMIVVQKRGNAAKNGLLHSIKHNKTEFVQFFVDNFLTQNNNNNNTNQNNNGNDNDNDNNDTENDNENDNNETENENENKVGDENLNDDLIVDIGLNVFVGAVPMIFVNAAYYGYLNVIKAMVAFDSSPLFINCVFGDFGSALCAATTSGHDEIVDYLLTLKGIDANVFNSSNETPLVIAAKNHHFSLFMKLFHFISPDTTFDVKNKEQVNLSFINFISTFDFNKEYCCVYKDKPENESNEYVLSLPLLPTLNLYTNENSGNFFIRKKPNSFAHSNVTFYKHIGNRLLSYILPEYFTREIDRSDDEKFIQFFTNSQLIDYGFNRCGCNFLITAVRSKNVELTRIFLEKKSTDVNFNDLYGMTATMYAVVNGSLDILKLLIEYGDKSEELNKKVDINRKNYYERTALSYAAYTNNFDIVRYILNLPTFDPEKSNLLLSIATAILCKRKKMALFLLNYSSSKFSFKMNTKMKFYKKVRKSLNYNMLTKSYESVSKTILDIAVECCDIDILEALFNHKSFDPTKFNQAKILYLSAASEKLEVFKFILEHFQNLNKKGNNDNFNNDLYDINFEYKGKSLLFASIFSTNISITKYIINHPDFDPIKSNAIASLCKAIIEKKVPKLRLIANLKGIDINCQCPQLSKVNEDKDRNSNRPFNFSNRDVENAAGMTPLSIAAFVCPLAFRELLNLPEIDVNSRCEDGSTPIFHFNTSFELELLFHQRNIDVNAQNNAGVTCLMNSVFQRLDGMIMPLMKIGADPFIKDKEGKTVFDYLGSDFKDVDMSNLDWREISKLILKALSNINY